MVIRRFDVCWVDLDPTRGSEIRKRRPCVVVSPDEMNEVLRTVIVAPMTTKGRLLPSRVACQFAGKQGLVVLDQIRTVDTSRIVEVADSIDADVQTKLLGVLAEMFAA